MKGGSSKPKENDSNEELIIVYETEKEHREPTERTLSLFRGKLDANIESKGSEDVDMKEVKAKEELKDKIKQKIDSHIKHEDIEHDVLNMKERDDDECPRPWSKERMRDLMEDSQAYRRS